MDEIIRVSISDGVSTVEERRPYIDGESRREIVATSLAASLEKLYIGNELTAIEILALAITNWPAVDANSPIGGIVIAAEHYLACIKLGVAGGE